VQLGTGGLKRKGKGPSDWGKKTGRGTRRTPKEKPGNAGRISSQKGQVDGSRSDYNEHEKNMQEKGTLLNIGNGGKDRPKNWGSSREYHITTTKSWWVGTEPS